MKKIVCFTVIFIMIMTSTCVSFGEDNTDKSLSPKKVVSILYDDSASMYIGDNPSWAYANYAMQTFTGLMNSHDSLYITFMSNPDKAVKSNSSGILSNFSKNRQHTVENIRDNTKGGSITPFKGIDTAAEVLTTVTDRDPSTEYWLVIITDGVFEKVPGDESSAASKSEIDNKLSKYGAIEMANNSNMKIVYMAIGSNTVVPEESSNIIVKQSNTTDIVWTLSEIADQISGRYRVDESKIKVSGNTVSVSSEIPLLNIQVLTQNSDAKVKSVKREDGGKLKVNTIDIKSPGSVSGRNTGDKLYGHINTVTSNGDYIEEGTYEIEFSDKVKKEDLVILYEAAIETKITIKKNDITIKDPSTLREGDKIDIYCKVVKMGTNDKIDVSVLPKDMYQGFELTVDEGDTEFINTSDFKYKGYEVTKQETTITGTATLTGFAPLVDIVKFTPKGPVVYGIVAGDNKNSVPINELGREPSQKTFTITGDGEPLGKAEVESLINSGSFSILHNNEKTPVKCEYEVLDNGEVVVTPNVSLLHQYILGYFSIPRGEYVLKLQVNEKVSATSAFNITFYTIGCLIKRLIALILFILLMGLIFRKRFPKGVITKSTYLVDSNDGTIVSARPIVTTTELTKMTGFVGLFTPCRTKVDGSDMKIYAKGNGQIEIDEQWSINNRKESEKNYERIAKPDMNSDLDKIVILREAAQQAYKDISLTGVPVKTKKTGIGTTFPMRDILYVKTKNQIVAYRWTKKK